MKHINLLSSLFLVGGTILTSCSSDESFGNTENIKRIEASICNFQMEDSNDMTRTSYTLGVNGYEAVWTAGDILGIYPLGGDQVSFPISDGAGTTNAVFDGGAWALRGTYRYAAYYPFSQENYTISETAIPVSYLGQKQSSNNATTHLAKYDFMAAAATQPSSNGSVTLPFKHLGSYLTLPLTLPKAGTYTKLTLTSSNGEFITKGTVDLSAATPAITATETSSSISLDLGNIVLTAGNLVLTVNMMIAPVNLTGSTITITVTDSNGDTYTNTEKAWTRSAAFEANTTYKASRVLAGSGTGGSIEGGGGLEDDDEDVTPYVTFKSKTEHSFEFTTYLSANIRNTIQYSLDGSPWTYLNTKEDYETKVNFGGDRGDLRIRAKSNVGTASPYYTYSTSDGIVNTENAGYISIGGETNDVFCSGDIRTLVDYESYNTVDCSNAGFSGLFKNCTVLVSAPELPSMTLADACYYSMFKGCTSLEQAPELPATTLTRSCYKEMFKGCTSLTIAPKLPALVLTVACYSEMFRNCSQLNTIEMDATDISAHYACGYWVNGVSSTGTFIKNSDATWSNSGVVPSGWTVRQKNPMHNGHEYVDLGLKDSEGHTIYWATCNIGAETLKDAGLYFAWGETLGYTSFPEGYDPTNPWPIYKWCNGSFNTLTKYCSDSEMGIVDNKTVLDPEDEAAHVNWGGNWRIPTRTELEWLINSNNCTWVWDSTNRYFLVTSKITSQSISVPPSWYSLGGTPGGELSSSSLSNSSSCYHISYVGESAVSRDLWATDRSALMQIRPVCTLSK